MRTLWILALLVLFAPYSCQKKSQEIFKVNTGEATDVQYKSVILQGTIIDPGGGVSNFGHCWAVHTKPELTDSLSTIGSTTRPQKFQTRVSNLEPGQTYYYRSYVRKMSHITYGETRSFTTASPGIAILSTDSITETTQTSARSGGLISSDGGASIKSRGVCWSTSANPTISDSHSTNGSGTGKFKSSLTDLTSHTSYYVRAYATNNIGTAYGNELAFTTLLSIAPPALSTTSVVSITHISAVSGGYITSDSGASITARGICWSTSPGPDISHSFTTEGTGIGSFSCTLTGLDANTSYYVRAYATNGAGTAYGNEKEFTTLPPPTLAELTTTTVSSITLSSASSGGSISSDGGGAITARGVCWNTSSNPDISNSHTADGSGMGGFTSVLTGLDANASYYVRAYATNGAGTAYGDEHSFATQDGPDCLPITLDNIIFIDITGCNGDSTGSIQVVASGGYGAPWHYSIDNGSSYASSSYFGDLPTGDYQVMAMDGAGCSALAPMITLTQPDELEVQIISIENIRETRDGSIVSVALGGTPPYIYWLYPDGAPQVIGTFIFSKDDAGSYVVAVNDINNCGPALSDSIFMDHIVCCDPK